MCSYMRKYWGALKLKSDARLSTQLDFKESGSECDTVEIFFQSSKTTPSTLNSDVYWVKQPVRKQISPLVHRNWFGLFLVLVLCHQTDSFYYYYYFFVIFVMSRLSVPYAVMFFYFWLTALLKILIWMGHQQYCGLKKNPVFCKCINEMVNSLCEQLYLS